MKRGEVVGRKEVSILRLCEEEKKFEPTPNLQPWWSATAIPLLDAH
jgi:hypothetical protein